MALCAWTAKRRSDVRMPTAGATWYRRRAMAIRSIELKDFTAFQAAKLELSPGVNVLIGRNGTGKTHVMKAAYAVARGSTPGSDASIGQKLALVFRPDDGQLGRLGHRRPGQRTSTLRVVDDGGGAASVRITTSSSRTVSEVSRFVPPAAVFVPSREGLAMFEGFAATYQKRELSFDETYYDLAMSLALPGLRGALPSSLKKIGADLERALGGKVVLAGPRFYLRGAGGSMLEAHLMSEGMRKLASILRLLQNGELRSTGLLLWDEPEANLNPHLTVIVARALARLAANEVQVVIATHDYLLTETLALLKREKQLSFGLRYFAFHRGADSAGVAVDGADSIADLKPNPIRDEFLAHYDRVRGVEV